MLHLIFIVCVRERRMHVNAHLKGGRGYLTRELWKRGSRTALFEELLAWKQSYCSVGCVAKRFRERVKGAFCENSDDYRHWFQQEKEGKKDGRRTIQIVSEKSQSWDQTWERHYYQRWGPCCGLLVLLILYTRWSHQCLGSAGWVGAAWRPCCFAVKQRGRGTTTSSAMGTNWSPVTWRNHRGAAWWTRSVR